MATYNLGQAAIVSKGAWSSSATYAVLNTVTHNGGSFMAISPNSNKEPGVAAGWATYWVAMSKGVKTVTIEAVTTTTAHAIVTYSDGTTETGPTFGTTGIPDNSITADMIQNRQVSGSKIALGTILQENMANNSVGSAQIIDESVGTDEIAPGAVDASRLASDILPANVGIKYGTVVPTAGTGEDQISEGQIYLKYS